MTDSEIEHGEPSGYKRCRLRPDGACNPCKRAKAAYMAEWRQRHPRHQAFEANKQEARNRALRRLAKMYPAELRALYDEELQAVTYPFTHLAGAS